MSGYNVGDRFRLVAIDGLNGAVVELIHINTEHSEMVRANWINIGIESISVPNFLVAFKILEIEDRPELLGRCFNMPITDIEDYSIKLFENPTTLERFFIHTCPYCKKPCYMGGMNNIKCSNPECYCYEKI